MKNVLIFLYLLAIVLANFIIYNVGQKGIIITSFLLIPFDFVVRAYFHETWKGKKLLRNLTILILSGSIITFILNYHTFNIALASLCAFLTAGIMASLFYQTIINKTLFFKINGSDLIAIIFDSIIFQLIAFSNISILIVISQIFVKFLGGLMWYWILFKKFNLQNKW